MIDCAPGRCIYSSGDRINRKYKVLKKLGEGTFGTVYKECIKSKIWTGKIMPSSY